MNSQHPSQEIIDRVINNFASTKNSSIHQSSLTEKMDEYNTPGISIAVINQYKPDWTYSEGYSNLEQKVCVNKDTCFQAASLSKSVFSTLVLKLCEDNHFKLDDPIIPQMKKIVMNPQNYDVSKITLRSILSHTAGLGVPGFPGYSKKHEIPSLLQILNGEPPCNTQKLELVAEPLKQFLYSGGGILLAQQFIMEKLNADYEQLVSEMILQPLKMKNSFFSTHEKQHGNHNLATGYPENNLSVEGGHHIYPELASSGLWSTPEELAFFGIELMNVFTSSANSKFLKLSSLTEILKPNQPEIQVINQTGGVGLGQNCNAGLGFFTNGSGSKFYFGHNGWNKGFLAQMRFYPHLGTGAVVMLNSNQGYPLLEEVMNAIGLEYNWPDIAPLASTNPNLRGFETYAEKFTSSKFDTI